jgi:hypothetical protein
MDLNKSASRSLCPFQGETVFSRPEVFSEVCAAVAAQVSFDRKLAVFPRFPRSSELFIAVRASSHSDSPFQLFKALPKKALRGFWL